MGAYEPRWVMYRMRMNPNDAVLAHKEVRSRHSIAIHFGLLDLAAAGWAPANDLAIARTTQGVAEAAIIAPHLGELLQF
jgi:hypothetical protein